jgi:hypothetical protein
MEDSKVKEVLLEASTSRSGEDKNGEKGDK